VASVIAIDLGQKRVGLAISDLDVRVAVPLMTLEGMRKRSDRIRRLIRLGEGRSVTQFVVGLPLLPDGQDGVGAAKAREFAERLAARSGLPVSLEDERYTSDAARRMLHESGASIDGRPEIVDQMSAVLILQSWLERTASEG
jgi:putative Holliday junction resolvase